MAVHTNILEKFFVDALNGIILTITKNMEEQVKIQKEEKRHEELKEKSIDVEFKVKENK